MTFALVRRSDPRTNAVFAKVASYLLGWLSGEPVLYLPGQSARNVAPCRVSRGQAATAK